MTRCERVIAAVNHQDTDIVPYSIGFTREERAKVAAYLGDDHFMEKIGNHITGAYFGATTTEVRPGYFADEFGVVWNRTVDKDIGVVDALHFEEPDMSLYTFPEVDEAAIRRGIEGMLASKGDAFGFAEIGFSMFERAWTLRGMENLLIDMIEEPEFVDALLDAVLAYNLKVMDIALEYPIDGFHFGDDWGQQAGLITGPTLWRRFIKPRMAAMYGKAKAKGLIISQHSCGDIHEIFDDLIDIGLNIYQTFQPEIYDIRAVKAEYGSRLTFWGGLSTQRLLPYATPAEIKAKAAEIIGVMGAGGGYIAGPTHGMPDDIPAENAVALIEALRDQPRR